MRLRRFGVNLWVSVYCRRVVLVILPLVVALPLHRVAGQVNDDPSNALAAADSLQRQQLVQLAPHVIRFNARTAAAPLEFRNTSDHPMQAQVQIQFAYVDYPHGLPGDTTVIDTIGGLINPHDTIIANPGPADHFLGRWVSGVPTTVILAPHEIKRVIVHLAAPPHLPVGEYWARIITLVRPTARHPGGQDVRQQFAMPVKGRAVLLQDTCAVIYREGEPRMGLEIGPNATALLDSANVGVGVEQGSFARALWVRLPLHLTGNAPFHGMMLSEYHNVSTGEIVNPNRQERDIYKDVVLHTVIESDILSPGEWEYTVWFDNERPEIPNAQRLPMMPVRRSFRFQILSAWQY